MTMVVGQKPEGVSAVPVDRRLFALFIDVAAAVVSSFVLGLVGLGCGRLLGADVPRFGIWFAIVGGSAVYGYSRLVLVGRCGQSLGHSEYGIACVDARSLEPIGVRRAAARELVALPLRGVVVVIAAIPLWLTAWCITSLFRGIPMVMLVIGGVVAIAYGMWLLVVSERGQQAIAAVSMHERVARSGCRNRSDAAEVVELPQWRIGPVHTWLARVALRSWVPVVLLSLYWLGSLGWDWPNRDRTWLPPAYEVWQSLTGFWWFERFTSDIYPTLWTIALGIVVALILGIALGALIGSNRIVARIVRPLLDFIRSIPKILLITPIVALAGSGATTSVIVILSGALWPLLLGTIDGVLGVNTQVHDLARSYRIPRRDKYTKMVLPAAAPNIFAGLRTSVSIGVILLVVVQSVGEARGIGFHLRAENEAFKYDNMFAAAAMLGALGYALNLLVGGFEKRILHWFYAKGTDV